MFVLITIMSEIQCLLSKSQNFDGKEKVDSFNIFLFSYTFSHKL